MDIRKYYSAYLSEIAYQDEENIRIKLEKIGFRFIKFFDFEPMQAYLCECKDGQTLVFRGSEADWNDWKTNFDIELIDTYIGKVHKGYFEILDEARVKIEKYILDKNILLTGHSAGAAFTCIMAKILDYKYRYNCSAIGFEPPKFTGDKNFYPKFVFTVNNADGVSRLPLKVMGYSRTGKMIFFNLRGRYIKHSYLLERIVSFLIDIDDIAKDHSMKEVRRLWVKNWEKINKNI